jgi:superfamily II DNA or RNA helicase
MYKGEWAGFADWLGTENVSSRERKFLSFKKARAFIRALGLKSQHKWRTYAASRKRPSNIPAAPNITYKSEWAGFGDWLGTGSVSSRERTFLPFKRARRYARALGLKSQREWKTYATSEARPTNIPGHPENTYKSEWAGYGDWLGTGRVWNSHRKFLPFKRARQHARALGLNSHREWRTYAASGERPSNIPGAPNTIYKGKWAGWADWLGYLGPACRWTTTAMAAFLKSIAPEIPNMRDAALVALITEAGLDAPLRELLGTPSLAHVIAALRENGDGIQERLRQRGEGAFEQGQEPEIGEDEEFARDELQVDANNIHVADRLRGKVSPKFIEHLVQERVCGLLVKYINGGQAEVKQILNHEGGKFYQEIKRRFESAVRGMMSVETSWWKLRDKKTGKPTEPNLMQRFIAYKLKHNRTWCNWSGTGAGKTGSAGLASYVIGSQLTVVLCPNSTVDQWPIELALAFHGSHAETSVANVKRGNGSFLILNYEKFQSEKSSGPLVEAIVGLRPDLVVLDEVQMIKRREQGDSSIRRETLEAMLRKLPKARVLAMTATPVINELREGVSLLEAVTGKPQNLRTRGRGAGAILDALNLHFALLQHGLRYKPVYRQSLSIQTRPFANDALLPSLQSAATGGADVLAIERTILPAKLEQVRCSIKPGTIIYLEFVQGMVPIVSRFVKSLGLSVGEYIGDTTRPERKETKQKFVAGELDVLIGSRAVGLGVDGLQARCNRLIILSLPWTHAAFEQVIGRVYRQGSQFAEIEVIIPQLSVAIDGEPWSWDEERYAVIEHKKTLSDTATDGYVRTSEPVSRKQFAKKAMDALKLMIQRAGMATSNNALATVAGM